LTSLQSAKSWGVSALVLALAGAAGAEAPVVPGVLIRGGLLLDGTDQPGRLLDLRTEGAHIVQIGPGLVRRRGEAVIEARGLALAPGFIDLHNHLDQRILARPGAESQIAQGITTALVGLDGESALPIGAFLDRVQTVHPALNVGTLVGHGAVRRAVMGRDVSRAARPAEIEAMGRLVDEALDQGAFGLSSGLEYDPGFEARPEELLALSALVARRGGLYATHLRDEREGGLAALDEAVSLARRAGVRLQVSHLKLGSRDVWGRARDALRLLGPDATADVYPYTYWVGSAAALLPRGVEPEAAARDVLADVGGAAQLRVVNDPAAPRRNGRTLEQIAMAERREAAALLGRLAATGGTLACACMAEDDLEVFLRDPRVSIASDGGLAVAHPRGAGTFPRVLGRYVRERGVLTLETAITKMTSAPAAQLGLLDRGRLAPGLAADLVVFDPGRVRDRATLQKPWLRPDGIVHVIVGGVAVVRDGRPTGRRSGRALRRSAVSLPGNVGHAQPLDGLAAPEMPVADLLEVREGDARVPDVVGLHGHRDTPAAVLQAARAVHDDPLVEPARLDHSLQLLEQRFGSFRRAGAFGARRVAKVEAHENVSLRRGHAPILAAIMNRRVFPGREETS
jgi:N-acyl-D-amino-acid deacylase